jgi:hypothetical protein
MLFHMQYFFPIDQNLLQISTHYTNSHPENLVTSSFEILIESFWAHYLAVITVLLMCLKQTQNTI